jgi:hypothetical protein
MRLGCDFHRFSFEAAWQTVLLFLSDPSGLGLLGTSSEPAYHVAKLTNEQLSMMFFHVLS